jgi:hypothetical protein
VTAAHLRELDLYDVAWLAGGRRRTAQTAVAALVQSGRVRVADPTGELHVIRPGAAHPVEAAVLDALGARGHRGIETLAFLVRADPRLDEVGEGLVARGLLGRGPLAALVRRVRPPATTRAGRRVLREARRSPGAGFRGSAAAGEVALAGLVRVPDGLPAALADPSASRWSLRRPEPAAGELARAHSGHFGTW